MAGDRRRRREGPALARSLRGRSRVAGTLIGWLRRSARLPKVSLRLVEVDGGPEAIFFDGRQRLLAVWALDVADGRIASNRSIVNPDKVKHPGPVGDFGSLLGSTS